jgi:HTH-type transcriptional regulator / antitoxin HigA
LITDKIKNAYIPDYAVHPGEILRETLEARQIKKGEFAERCGISAKTVSQIIAGKAPVTSSAALNFERVLGVSSNIWNNLNSNYLLFAAKKREQIKLGRQKAWAQKFPLKEMIKRGLIEEKQNAIDTIREILDFFSVGTISAWEIRFKRLSVAYRHSLTYKSSPHALFTWLQIGQRMAERMECKPYDAATFRATLDNIRNTTIEDARQASIKLIKGCQEAGVAVVFVSELPGTHLSGATRWLNKDKALIMLSLRHKTDDHLWFSFFHEAGHIIKHGRKCIFLDETEKMINNYEDEANQFASDILINKTDYDAFIQEGDFSHKSIRRFASQQNIAPGIVVGRLQHDKKLNYNQMNSLKRSLKLDESHQ